jgi:hypothetical protein
VGAVASPTTPGGLSQNSLTPSTTEQPLSLTPSASSNPSQTTSSTSELALTSATIPSLTPLPDASSSNLSPGAKAGIGVGAAIGGLLLFGIIAYFLVQYGIRIAAKTGKEDSSLEKAELETRNPQPQTAELGGNLRSEMDGTGKAVEIG